MKITLKDINKMKDGDLLEIINSTDDIVLKRKIILQIDSVKILDDGSLLSYSEDGTLGLWSSEGVHLNALYLISDGIEFDDIQQEKILAKNDKYFLLYEYYDGAKATTLEGIAQKSDALLYEDGIYE